ncbi:hypothetical protein J1N35_007331 [Gossypium stocksii]|uniref:hAT-like transposase RNase-H fold domain-containing protein n=1 Tax=Gossypium stocksii TaxID=47602 RepID=A0A9D4AFG6_9ROSI|nr:hypothetical protein J1N35_007331 [Gossypium stocksii]
MLKSTLNFQRAFEMLQEDDPKFLEDLDDGAPTTDDRNNARILVKFLEVFYNTSLKEWTKSSKLHIQPMAFKIKERFHKYWGTNLSLLVSMALDPR